MMAAWSGKTSQTDCSDLRQVLEAVQRWLSMETVDKVQVIDRCNRDIQLVVDIGDARNRAHHRFSRNFLFAVDNPISLTRGVVTKLRYGGD
jgi:hypothetical protein